MNPLLLSAFSTPHNTFPFPEIGVSQIEEAILAGMQQEKEEIEAIINNPEPASFQNTIEALENSGALLERATTVMYNQLSAHTNDDLEALAEKVAPILSKHRDEIMQRDSLFQRVKTVYETAQQQAELGEEEKMLLAKTYEAFERSGATLSAEKKEVYKRIRAQLSKLSLQFSQNNIKATNSFILHLTDENDLVGLPEGIVEQAAATAKERELTGWAFTLHAPSYVPFMQYAASRSLREKMYRAYMSRCAEAGEYNNLEVCRQLINLRQELAQLLDHPNYAAYVLTKRMASNQATVENFLRQLSEAYLPAAQQEVERIRAFAREQEGEDFELMPWDFAFYAHHLKLRDYNLDAEMLRPYFELSKVTAGVLGLATKLYGITFKACADIPVYHDDVKAYEVFDADGHFLAVLYTDFFPRASKQSGAWMTSYREQYMDGSEDHRPHVSVTMNFTPPTPSKPSLLTFEEVETFLHEFGHALHGIFAQSKYKSLSGTNVYWDFVELPSQIMENFAYQSEFLQTFAHHYQTGEPIPSELIERIKRSRNFNVAYACIRQVSFGLLDMAYYTLTTPLTTDIQTFEREAWASVQLLPVVPDACMTVSFGHIMSGGYAAGYYSYKWAEVLDADAFEAFQEAGLFAPEVASRFRQHILSRGGTAHPQELYNNFRGRPASLDALLRRDGLSVAQ